MRVVKNNHFTPASFESPIFPTPEKKTHLQRLIKLEQETQSLSAKSQPGEGRELLESLLLLHGVLVKHHAVGKVTAQPRSPLGASMDFPPHKNRFTTDNLHSISPQDQTKVLQHLSASVNPAALHTTEKNLLHCFDNLVVCHFFLSELKPVLITAKGMSQLKGSFYLSVYIRAFMAFRMYSLWGHMWSKPFATFPGAFALHNDDLAKQIAYALPERTWYVLPGYII